MKIFEEISTPKYFLRGFKCDYCSKEFANENQNFATLTYNPGYGSQFDGDLWEHHLCENCWIEISKLITGVKPTPDKKSLGLQSRIEFYQSD